MVRHNLWRLYRIFLTRYAGFLYLMLTTFPGKTLTLGTSRFGWKNWQSSLAERMGSNQGALDWLSPGSVLVSRLRWLLGVNGQTMSIITFVHFLAPPMIPRSWTTLLSIKLAEKNGGKGKPEMRMPLVIPGAISVCMGLLWALQIPNCVGDVVLTTIY